jgi:RND superfamily putative drug exporter
VAKQQGFAMAFGILLASLVVSSILVPALTAVAGRRVWWPHGSTRRSVAKSPVPEVVPHASR